MHLPCTFVQIEIAATKEDKLGYHVIAHVWALCRKILTWWPSCNDAVTLLFVCHHPMPCCIDVSLFLYFLHFHLRIIQPFQWQCIFNTCTMYQLSCSLSIWQLYRHIVIMKHCCRTWKMVQVRSVVLVIMKSLQKTSYLKQMEILLQQLDTSLYVNLKQMYTL